MSTNNKKCTCSKCGKDYTAKLQSDHRVMCGDSTKQDDVNLLMDGKIAHMVFCDPPWNVRPMYLVAA